MSKAFTKEDSDVETPDDDDLADRLLAGDGPRHITAEGFQRLQREFHEGSTVLRPALVKEGTDAAVQGERPESAEAIQRKTRLRDLDRRLRFLPRLLERLTVVPDEPRTDGRAFFGAHVTVEDEDGKRTTYRIVGPDEINAERGYISVDSPLGKALRGKRAGDEVTVARPRGDTELSVVSVRYGA